MSGLIQPLSSASRASGKRFQAGPGSSEVDLPDRILISPRQAAIALRVNSSRQRANALHVTQLRQPLSLVGQAAPS